MPFINNVLGYDVFDPTEVSQSLYAILERRKVKRIDYAILKIARFRFHWMQKLAIPNINHASQLFRYFASKCKNIYSNQWQVYKFLLI